MELLFGVSLLAVEMCVTLRLTFEQATGQQARQVFGRG
jgi:hypothetical protein